ncbi:MAG: alanine racemase [Clostridia bacterium]
MEEKCFELESCRELEKSRELESCRELEMCREWDRCCEKINLSCVENNCKILKRLAQERAVFCVLKADAYGHGSVAVAKLLENQCDYFAVATAEEGLELRRAGITRAVIVLGFVDRENYLCAVENDLTLSCFGKFDIQACNLLAEQCGKVAKIHLATNCGMNRIGCSVGQAVAVAQEIVACKSLFLEGVFSHYSCADSDQVETRKQSAQFCAVVENLRAAGIAPRYRHIANSYALLGGEQIVGNAVRVGISLFGGVTSDLQLKFGLKESSSFVGKIVDIRRVLQGEKVGYGGQIVAKNLFLATVAAGYADGLPRGFSGCGGGYLRGEFLPIVGKVCMDMCMLDIGDGERAQVGDEVTFWGVESGKSVCEIAGRANMSEYELLARVGKRVEKLYI